MPSKARKALDANMADIDRLLEIHKNVGGGLKGRRYGLEVVNKSAIVLICAFWEAYCEDLAAEALEHIVTHAKSADSLPTELRKAILKSLSAEKDELAAWKICGDGWRQAARDRFAALKEARDRKLNTPKSEQIDQLFLDAIGLKTMSQHWRWSKRLTVAGARTKLDKFVTLRGSIAHRGSATGSVTKAQVTDFKEFTSNLASRSGGAVNRFVQNAVGKRLW
jgi:RiboL-PSP-HEPN